jgi:hypothetical protein
MFAVIVPFLREIASAIIVSNRQNAHLLAVTCLSAATGRDLFAAYITDDHEFVVVIPDRNEVKVRSSQLSLQRTPLITT